MTRQILQTVYRLRYVGCGLCLAVMLAGGVSVVGCASSAPGAAEVAVNVSDWRFGRATGTKLQTEHYTVYTTVTDADLLDRLPEFMETAYAQYGSVLPSDRPFENRQESYLFATRRQWEQFTRVMYGGRSRTYLRIRSGGYTEQDRCVTYYTRRETTLAVLAHEGFHQYIYQQFGPRVPAWVNEGLACYVENYDWRNGHPIFAPESNRFRINHLRQALAGSSTIDVMDLVGMHAGDALQGTHSGVNLYYAQVWSLVMFLLDDPKSDYGQGFARLLADLGTDRMMTGAKAQIVATPSEQLDLGQATFLHYITEDIPTFTAAYLDYVHELTGLRSGKRRNPWLLP